MPKQLFQPTLNEGTKLINCRVEDAFAFMVQNSSQADFTRAFDALWDLRYTNPQLWRSLMGVKLIREVFHMVDTENKYRMQRQERGDQLCE